MIFRITFKALEEGFLHEQVKSAEAKIDLEDAHEALADTKKNGVIPWEEIKRKWKL
ncbi:MAG: hypothetical protein Q8L98_08625 [Chlamydiales bacterium]|nr:hypothetical protein [Chlamydiales bacterium]